MTNKKPGPPARICAILLRGVSRDVRDHFKSLCAKKGTSMTAEIVDFMRSSVKQANRYP